jgi:hypothetical protein
MNDLLLWLGRLAGATGLAVCAAAALLRMTGAYWVAGFQVGTLLLAGTALLIVGCFFLLLLVTSSTSSRPRDG